MYVSFFVWTMLFIEASYSLKNTAGWIAIFMLVMSHNLAVSFMNIHQPEPSSLLMFSFKMKHCLNTIQPPGTDAYIIWFTITALTHTHNLLSDIQMHIRNLHSEMSPPRLLSLRMTGRYCLMLSHEQMCGFIEQ